EGRAEDERVPGVPEPHAVADDTRSPDPGTRDPRERRPVHARSHGRPGQPRRPLLPAVARATETRSGAPDRPRLLPGDPRPDRTRAGARGRNGRARGADSSGLASVGPPKQTLGTWRSSPSTVCRLLPALVLATQVSR